MNIDEDAREAAFTAANEACRNMDGDLDLDALSRHFERYRANAWPRALTPELRALLGQMCFVLGPIAHVYQAIGEFTDSDGAELGRRAEDEQAFMLHKMLTYWFANTKTWPDASVADLNRARARLPEKHRHYKPAAGAQA